MLVLLLSLLPLALGPLLVAWARRARWTAVSLDSFVIVSVGGMVLLHVLPDALGRGGWWAVLALVVGLLAPVLAEQGLAPTGRRTRVTVLVFVVLAMLLHSLVDGAALTGTALPHTHAPGAGMPGHEGHDHGSVDPSLLVWAVLLHRLLEGLAIWWVVPRTLGVGYAIAAAAIVGIGTAAGYYVGSGALADAPATGIAIFEALLCGTLMHVVLHAHIPAPRAAGTERWHVASVVGGAVGAATMYALTASHSHAPTMGGHGPGEIFWSLLLQSAPALVFGYLAVGLSQAFLPSDWARRLTGKTAAGQALRGMAIGLPLPVCSCGVVPLYRDLIGKGAPMAAAIAFLVATPELEIAAILLSWQLLGPDIAIARVLTAAALAFLVALVVHRVARSRMRKAPVPGGASIAPQRSVRGVLRAGFVSAVDDTGSWIVAGLALAAILTPYLDPAMVASLPAGIDVPVAALIGMPLYVCASGSTPLAAVLVMQGVSPGAAIAFLLTGPATNITTYGILSSLHGRAVAVAFASSMLALAIGMGWAVNAWLASPTPLATVDIHHHHGTWLQLACVAILSVAFLGFLLRVGVRGALARLFMAHAHGEGNGDEHGGEHACCH